MTSTPLARNDLLHTRAPRIAACVLALLLSTGLGVGCGDEVVEGAVCDAVLKLRLSAPNPLLGQPRADVADVTIERGGALASSATFQLIDIDTPQAKIQVIDELSGLPPAVEPSSQLRVTFAAYSSFGSNYLARGATAVFACPADSSVEIPMYVGPADGLARTAGAPLAKRQQATATLLDDGRVLIIGGTDENGQGASPAVAIYDHRTGRFCGEGADCPVGERPQGAPQALVGHSATRLADGSVLVLGGRAPGQSDGLEQAYRFDPDTNAFSELSFDAPLGKRHRHLSVLLDGFNVAPAQQGKVLVVGGCRGPCGPGEVPSEALLLSMEEGAVTRLPGFSGYEGSATLLSSGKVLLAGGRDENNQLSSAAWLFDTETRTFDAVLNACPGSSVSGLCAARAGHAAVELDDGNVLLYGGDVASAGGDTPPVGEVFLLVEEKSVPLTGTVEAGSRIGHTLTPLDCAAAPCPILVVGGQDPASASQPAPPALLRPGSKGASSYGAQIEALASLGDLASRAWHVSTLLDDGAVLVSGGRAPDTGAIQDTATIYSPCEPSAAIGCPLAPK